MSTDGTIKEELNEDMTEVIGKDIFDTSYTEEVQEA